MAKLARQTSSFYDDSYHTLITRSEVDKSWAATCQAKAAVFNAEALYKQGLVDIEEKEFGTAVARLKAAHNAIQRAAEVGQGVKLDVKVGAGLGRRGSAGETGKRRWPGVNEKRERETRREDATHKQGNREEQ